MGSWPGQGASRKRPASCVPGFLPGTMLQHRLIHAFVRSSCPDSYNLRVPGF